MGGGVDRVEVARAAGVELAAQELDVERERVELVVERERDAGCELGARAVVTDAQEARVERGQLAIGALQRGEARRPRGHVAHQRHRAHSGGDRAGAQLQVAIAARPERSAGAHRFTRGTQRGRGRFGAESIHAPRRPHRFAAGVDQQHRLLDVVEHRAQLAGHRARAGGGLARAQLQRRAHQALGRQLGCERGRVAPGRRRRAAGERDARRAELAQHLAHSARFAAARVLARDRAERRRRVAVAIGQRARDLVEKRARAAVEPARAQLAFEPPRDRRPLGAQALAQLLGRALAPPRRASLAHRQRAPITDEPEQAVRRYGSGTGSTQP